MVGGGTHPLIVEEALVAIGNGVLVELVSLNPGHPAKAYNQYEFTPSKIQEKNLPASAAVLLIGTGVTGSSEYPGGIVPSNLTVTNPTPTERNANLAFPPTNEALNQEINPEAVLNVVSMSAGLSGPNLKLAPPATMSDGPANPNVPTGDTIRPSGST